MALDEILRERGYAFRQHLDEVVWTRRAPTVVDLDDEQRLALAADGIQGLARVLEQQGRWSFPASDLEEPLPVDADTVIALNGRVLVTVVMPLMAPRLAEVARDLAAAVEKRFGLVLPLCSDREAGAELLESRHLIVVGGAHRNRLAMDLALRYQTGFVDAVVPGEDGWVVTTHVGWHASGNDVVQMEASSDAWDTALECFLDHLSGDGDRLVLRRPHRICPGERMRSHLPSWEEFAAGLPGRIPRLQGQKIEATTDPVVLADLLAVGLDSGGPAVNLYNVAPIDIAVGCARYYQITGEQRALRLFRELLFRLADYYLKTPGGASYPADLDFRLGPLILYYARLEHESVFSREDRLILGNLLLACTRSIYAYTVTMWPIDPATSTRHNHETFAARSLMQAAGYFSRYGIDDVAAWIARAEEVFSGALWSRCKQKENANGYELMAFEHGAAYSAAAGQGLGLFEGDCLHRVVGRQMAATDNFFRPVDYGDSSISMGPISAALADILASQTADERVRRTVDEKARQTADERVRRTADERVRETGDEKVRWFSHQAFQRRPEYLGNAIHGIPGIRCAYEGKPPPAGNWELVPLEPRFIQEYAPGFSRGLAFDKLAFRTGWEDDDHYLLLEGVGGRRVSHGHNEVNGLVRLNHLGRHWVVSNGYGRRAGLSNVNESFNTRILGPEDHNMLVLRRDGEIVRELPVCSALIQRGRKGDLLFATGVLSEYGGTNWFRTLVVLADRFVLVVDRIQVVQSGLEGAHVEWNCLGATEHRDGPGGQGGRFRLAQQGVFMDVSSGSGWEMEQGVADRSADWKGVLAGKRYPYATFPLQKLSFQMPSVEAGQVHCLATLLAATSADTPEFVVAQPESGRVIVTGPHGLREGTEVADRDLALRIAGESLEVRFAEIPALPCELKR